MLVGGIIVEDDMHGLLRRHGVLDGIEEADELLMAMPLHVAPDYSAVEHVEGGEQRRCAISLIVVGHCAGAAFLHGQPRLRAVERLDLALSSTESTIALSGGFM